MRRAAIAGLLGLLAALSLAGTAEAGKLVYGVVPQNGALPSPKDLNRMPGAGITGLRTMLPWGVVEQSPGVYDWTVPDGIIRELTERGIQPLLFLYGTPPWAAHQDGRRCSGGRCAVYPPKSPSTRAAFGAFARAAAERYGPGGDFWVAPARVEACTIPLDPLCTQPPPPPPTGPVPPQGPPCECTVAHPITAWQIWNEQNSPKYFAPKVDPGKYVSMLRSAYEGIRAADPGAEVILGGMWGPSSATGIVMPTATYLERMYKLGAKSWFDSVAIHPYASNADASLAQLDSARRVMRENGDGAAGLWVTEIGWAGRGPKDEPYVKGLSGQARILTRALTGYEQRARSLRLRGVFWYSWRDLAGGSLLCTWCGHAGLRTKAGHPKPAWRAFKRIARH